MCTQGSGCVVQRSSWFRHRGEQIASFIYTRTKKFRCRVDTVSTEDTARPGGAGSARGLNSDQMRVGLRASVCQRPTEALPTCTPPPAAVQRDRGQSSRVAARRPWPYYQYHGVHTSIDVHGRSVAVLSAASGERSRYDRSAMRAVLVTAFSSLIMGHVSKHGIVCVGSYSLVLDLSMFVFASNQYRIKELHGV